MTSPPMVAVPVADDPTEPLAPLIAPGTRAARWLVVVLLGILVLTYLLLQNPYWVRHGDSEVMLSLGRSLALGEGYKFCGQPVAIVPPGWPALLAGAMKFTSELAWLKLLPMLSLVGFLIASYLVLTRYATPMVAAFCVLTTVLLDPVFSLSHVFFSDGPFSLVAMAAVCIAFRINRGADSWGWIALLALLCALSVFIRWAGLLWLAVVAGALLTGEQQPRLHRRWIAAGVVTVLTFGTFVGLRFAMQVDPSQLDPRYDSFLATMYDVVNLDEDVAAHMSRVQNLGLWFSGLLWEPLLQVRLTRGVSNYAGWLVIALLVVALHDWIRSRQWVWLGAAAYIGALATNWPNPMPRYIVPLAPFVLVGSYQGICRIASWLPTRLGWIRVAALNVFFATIFLVNGLLYLYEVSTMRSAQFYDKSDGGMNQGLIDAAAYLNRQPQGDYEIAISSRCINFGRVFFTDGYRRALCFLTNRSVVTVPHPPQHPNLCREPDDEVVQWLMKHNVRYYLYQPPIWVVQHFALKSRDGVPILNDETAWRLYEIRDGTVHRVWPLDRAPELTQVPGLQTRRD